MTSPLTASELYAYCRKWEAALQEVKQLPQEALVQGIQTLVAGLPYIVGYHGSLSEEEKRTFILPRIILSGLAEAFHLQKAQLTITKFNVQSISKEDARIRTLPAYNAAYWEVEELTPDRKPIEIPTEEEGGSRNESEVDELVEDIPEEEKSVDKKEKKKRASEKGKEREILEQEEAGDDNPAGTGSFRAEESGESETISGGPQQGGFKGGVVGTWWGRRGK
ncbi:hypothetical protein BDN72DRAFT_906065 [Pluteus cervinus]|uniref:Uncharacterized protein n=1 Tax=Pluteus cervinus TaxID=181527 RepID=A0ACD3A0K8_9AGAR|nr:hypothetical protein BDN72DRAFT_906065 [Pluteus cervinus]